jgi:hypothetical protein
MSGVPLIQVDAARPTCHRADAVTDEVPFGETRGGERQVGLVVDVPEPGPGRVRAHAPPVAVEDRREVGLIDSGRRDGQALGGPTCCLSDHERGGHMDDVRFERLEHPSGSPGGQADRQVGEDRRSDGGKSQHECAPVRAATRRAGPRGQHGDVMTGSLQVVNHLENRVGHAVPVGKEALGDNGHAHHPPH